jgi:hypothetical protein
MVLTAVAAPPVIDNRPAQQDEWGYRPADGSTAVMNPPSFTWIHDKRAGKNRGISPTGDS